jgi:hypothetical protein
MLNFVCARAGLVACAIIACHGTQIAEAASSERTVAGIFASDRIDGGTLARDGRYVAFAIRSGSDLRILIRDIEHPGAETLNTLGASAEPRLDLLCWTADGRVIATTDTAVVVAIDARTGTARRLAHATSLPRAGPKSRDRDQTSARADTR